MADDIKSIVAEGLKGLVPAAPIQEGNPGAGLLENIPSMKIFGLQVGDALKGLVAAGVGDAAVAIIKPRLPATLGTVNTSAALAKGIVAALYQTKQAKGLLGSDAANLGSLLLVIDAITELVQVRTSVFNLIKKVTGGFIPGSGLVYGGNPASPPVAISVPTPVPVPSGVVASAARIADDYYARLGGS